MQKSSGERPIRTYEEMLGMIRTALGGKAAEIVYYGKKDGNSTGASGDLRQATGIAGVLSAVTEWMRNSDWPCIQRKKCSMEHWAMK